MRQAEEKVVTVQLKADGGVFQELANAYTELADKAKAEGSKELFETFLKFSESFERFLKTLSLKLDNSSANTTD
ncbi:hypothetical protein [Desulfurobacterium sp.]